MSYGPALLPVPESLMRKRYTFLAVVASLVALLILGVGTLHWAARELRTRIVAALGPDAEIGSLVLDGTVVEIRKLRIRAPAGWPAPDTLRAELIVVEPDLRALLSGEVRVGRIAAEQAYLSVLRTEQGAVRLLPSLLERPQDAKPPAGAASAPADEGAPVVIESVELKDGVVEFFDANVRKVPHKLRVVDIDATVGRLVLPALDAQTAIDLTGTIKGPKRDGALAVNGWTRFDNRDGELKMRLGGVDLLALEPYLLKPGDGTIKRGSLDLSLDARVKAGHIHAPGTLTLSQIELAGGRFMGLPRQAVVAALRSRKGTITVRFEVQGRLDDPAFSLREGFAKQVALAVGEGLGLSVKGLAKGAAGAAPGLAGALERWLGGAK